MLTTNRHTMAWLFLVTILISCVLALGQTQAQGPGVTVGDIGLATQFQDLFFGHHKRGRALLAADFDLDGRIDFYLGNPGDESFVIRNVVETYPAFRFEVVQVLLVGDLAWGGVTFDYDNDGDYDIFVTSGGNEGEGFDYLFRNMWLESGQTQLYFEDVTGSAGVAGPIPPGGSEPIAVASANAVAADYNMDGHVDIFVNVYVLPGTTPPMAGRNILWRNNGDGTFTDGTEAVGLGTSLTATQHSTFFDFDNDGDMDLFENNWKNDPADVTGFNILWRNKLMETGAAEFEDVTLQFSNLPIDDLRYPVQSFDSVAADVNNDGWEDLLVLMKGTGPEPGSPYPEGHLIFLNEAGTGFRNIADLAMLNNPFISDQGIMGCQVGDVNGDGVPDVYLGNGTQGPGGGQFDQLFVSLSRPGELPLYANQSPLIDFPAPEAPGMDYAPYPYRTHGTAFIDVDNDGSLEIAVSNGGPAIQPDEVREPNRLFKFVYETPANYLKVRPVGDGERVSRDAIGTRLALTVHSSSAGQSWTVYRTLYSGSCFSAHSGFEVHFGLGAADTIEQLVITWPDGVVETIQKGLTVNSAIVVERAPVSELRATYLPYVSR